VRSIAILTRHAVAGLVLSLLLASPAVSDTRRSDAVPASSLDLSRIHIENFGCVNPSYYRGAQPIGGNYAELAAIGIRTLVDLRGDDGDLAEKDEAARLGLAYVRIPMTTREAPSQETLAEFLRVVTDPQRQPVYVHCVGGRHRTGVMTAVYRMTQDGWSPDRAFREMKSFKFGPDFLHPEFKAFVFGYTPDVPQLKPDSALAAP
jgi:tyrosine-protein phosphatase SIW14